MLVSDLKKVIREVPDFPKPGVLFYDVSTVFERFDATRLVVGTLTERFRGEGVDVVVGIEARGFVLAALVAHQLGLGLAMVRKPGKLPRETLAEDYELEYGRGRLEMHRDAIGEKGRVLVVDDVLATGGTAAATGRLVARAGGRVVAFSFLAELEFLSGRSRLEGTEVFSLLRYG